MLLSAVSVLVVAQSSSEIPEVLMNNPVYCGEYQIASLFPGKLYKVFISFVSKTRGAK